MTTAPLAPGFGPYLDGLVPPRPTELAAMEAEAARTGVRMKTIRPSAKATEVPFAHPAVALPRTTDRDELQRICRES